MSDPNPKSYTGGSMKYAGMGFEFASAVGGFCVVGWWIDRHWQIENHKGLLICAGLGMIGGLYNFIRQAMAATAETRRLSGRSKHNTHNNGQP